MTDAFRTGLEDLDVEEFVDASRCRRAAGQRTGGVVIAGG